MDTRPPLAPAILPKAADLLIALQRTHMSLSQMADQKASILMGAAFVILAIAIGQASAGHASPALLMLGTTAFGTAVLAVLAILPTTGAKAGRPNLLFFGSFTAMSEDAFVDALFARIRAEDSLLEAVMRDVYQNGQVLARKKYRLLGHAYRVFLAGLTLSFLAFAAQHLGLWRG